MGSQIMFLKVVHQWLIWPLIWIRMVQSTHYRAKRHILMVATPDVQVIKLALFVYHMAMHHILRLAMMEVKSESTHEIIIFWELFNEILSEIKGKNYKFNPKSIMVDENGANYCTIREGLLDWNLQLLK